MSSMGLYCKDSKERCVHVQDNYGEIYIRDTRVCRQCPWYRLEDGFFPCALSINLTEYPEAWDILYEDEEEV